LVIKDSLCYDILVCVIRRLWLGFKNSYQSAATWVALSDQDY